MDNLKTIEEHKEELRYKGIPPCNYCGYKGKTYKTCVFHLTAWLCRKCKTLMVEAICEAAWIYLKVKKENM